MSEENRSFEQRLSLAINSSDFGILAELMNSASSKIRRAVARNRNSPKNVVNELAYDPVLNVSYKALEHPNCSVQREIDEEIHPCVSCNVPEDKKNCRSVCKAGIFV